MQYVRCPITTICVGMAASMGAVILAAGSDGKRKALPHSRIMIHQPHGGSRGQVSDIEIIAKEMLRTKQTLNEILSRHSGQPVENINKDSDRDNYMSAAEAKEYGLIDDVVAHKKEIKGPTPTT